MAYETIEKRASELATGDRVLRKNVAWYVDNCVVGASGDIDVTLRLTRHHPLRSVQTYAPDDPVDVIVSGFSDRPNFTSENTAPHAQLVREWVRQAVKRGCR